MRQSSLFDNDPIPKIECPTLPPVSHAPNPALFLDECPIEPTISFNEALRDRAYWLVGLLMMQSFSGIILSRNEALLADHPVIIFFLTMLVGAGGNAGNQASVRGTYVGKRQTSPLANHGNAGQPLVFLLPFSYSDSWIGVRNIE